MISTSVFNRTSGFLKLAAPLVLIASIGTLTSAATPRDAESGAATITLRVYDYAHAHRTTLLAAERKADGILATAGVSARWVDCPTSHAAVQDYPDCQSAPQIDDYMLILLPDRMAGALGGQQNALAAVQDASGRPHRASIFYDRINARVGGDTAAAEVLLARVMAREIGALLLGGNASSRTGLMKSSWSEDDLSMEADPAMVFTAEQERQIQTQLAAQAQTLQPQTQIAKNNPR